MKTGTTKSRSGLVRAAALSFALVVAAASAYAAAPAASSFDPFVTDGLFLSPAFTSGVTSYTLTLGTAPTLTYGGNDYAITQVWGFYAVNKTGSAANDITASGNATGAWGFDTNPNSPPVAVAGWSNPSKNEAVVPGGSKDFAFTTFSYNGSAPVLGLHVTLDLGTKPSPFASGGNTGGIIPTINPVIPELPTGVLGSLGVFAAAILRKLRRTCG